MKTNMNYNELNSFIGDSGPFQWRAFFVMCVSALLITDSIHMVFIGGEMEHWCRVEQLAGLSYDVQKNVAIPTENGSGRVKYSSCSMYALNYSLYNEAQFVNWNRSEMITDDTPVISCKQWTYDQSTFTATIISKFNLVCGHDLLVPLVSSIFQAGLLISAILSGVLSDRFGRKPIMLLFYAIKIIGSAMSLFGTKYSVFLIGRFLIGAGGVGAYLPGFVILMEIVGKTYRSWYGSLLHVAWSVGYMLLSVFAYFLRNEFWLQLAVLTPNVVFPVLIVFLFPESPRWLFVNEKREKLISLVTRIAKCNRRQLPADFHSTTIEKVEKGHSGSFIALWKSKAIRRRLIIFHSSWFTCSLIYYALSLNVGTLSGDLFVNSFMSGAVEIPSYIIGIVLMNWKPLGRRLTGCVSMVVAGLVSFSCIPIVMLGYAMTASILSILGKAFICVTYSVVYVYGAELFPTEVRNIGIGSGSSFSKIAAMSASFVGGPLRNVWTPLPSLLFGIFSTLSGISYLLLPETLGQPLINTISQAEHSGNRSAIMPSKAEGNQTEMSDRDEEKRNR